MNLKYNEIDNRAAPGLDPTIYVCRRCLHHQVLLASQAPYNRWDGTQGDILPLCQADYRVQRTTLAPRQHPPV